MGAPVRIFLMFLMFFPCELRFLDWSGRIINKLNNHELLATQCSVLLCFLVTIWRLEVWWLYCIAGLDTQCVTIKCNNCISKTNTDSNIKNHMLQDKIPLVLPSRYLCVTFECNKCGLKTKTVNNIRNHMLPDRPLWVLPSIKVSMRDIEMSQLWLRDPDGHQSEESHASRCSWCSMIGIIYHKHNINRELVL